MDSLEISDKEAASFVNRLKLIKSAEKFLDFFQELINNGSFYRYHLDLSEPYLTKYRDLYYKKSIEFGIDIFDFDSSTFKKLKENSHIFNNLKMSQDPSKIMRWITELLNKVGYYPLEIIFKDSNPLYEKFKVILIPYIDVLRAHNVSI